MTPETARIIDMLGDENVGKEIAEIISRHVCFDASRVLQLIEEMANKNCEALYPLFLTMPADNVCIDVGRSAIICEKSGNSVKSYLVSDIALKISESYIKGAADTYIKTFLQNGETPPEWAVKSAFRQDKELREEVVNVGQIIAPRAEGQTLSIMASCAFDIIAQQNLFVTRDESIPRNVRRRIERSGHAVTRHAVIDFCRTYTSGGSSTGSGSKKALHFVAGHWRRSQGPRSMIVQGMRKTWIEGHWRGDPTLGIVAKSYVTGRKFLGAMAAKGKS